MRTAKAVRPAQTGSDSHGRPPRSRSAWRTPPQCSDRSPSGNLILAESCPLSQVDSRFSGAARTRAQQPHSGSRQPSWNGRLCWLARPQRQTGLITACATIRPFSKNRNNTRSSPTTGWQWIFTKPHPRVLPPVESPACCKACARQGSAKQMGAIGCILQAISRKRGDPGRRVIWAPKTSLITPRRAGWALSSRRCCKTYTLSNRCSAPVCSNRTWYASEAQDK